MERNVIKIYDFTKEFAVEAKVGERINELIKNILKKDSFVCLDFSNVKIVLTAFLKEVIGSYIEDLSEEEFAEKIRIINLPEYSNKTMEKIFDVFKKSCRL